MSDAARPTFTVVIPTYARPGRVRACLSAIAVLSYPRDRFDVVVVDDGSPTPPDAEVAEFAGRLRVSVVRQANAGPGAARNLGARHATGEYLAFTADDCAPHADWLDALAAAFAQYPGRLIGGRVEHALPDNPCATASHLLIDYLYAHYNRDPAAARFFTPNNMAVPAARFAEIGGFDITTGATGEDRDFCHRWRDRGWTMAYVPGAAVRHAHPLTFRSFLSQQYAYGVGSAKYRRLLAARGAGTKVRTGAFEPLSFYAKLVVHPLTCGKGPRAWAHVGLLCASQAANALGVLVEGRRRGPSSGSVGGGLPAGASRKAAPMPVGEPTATRPVP